MEQKMIRIALCTIGEFFYFIILGSDRIYVNYEFTDGKNVIQQIDLNGLFQLNIYDIDQTH